MLVVALGLIVSLGPAISSYSSPVTAVELIVPPYTLLRLGETRTAIPIRWRIAPHPDNRSWVLTWNSENYSGLSSAECKRSGWHERQPLLEAGNYTVRLCVIRVGGASVCAERHLRVIGS